MGRPHLYLDEFERERRLVFSRSRAQARFRGEIWELSFEEFCEFWNSEFLWVQRGRQPDCLVLSRFDKNLPWKTQNCSITTRLEQLQILGRSRQGRKYGKSLDTTA